MSARAHSISDVECAEGVVRRAHTHTLSLDWAKHFRSISLWPKRVCPRDKYREQHRFARARALNPLPPLTLLCLYFHLKTREHTRTWSRSQSERKKCSPTHTLTHARTQTHTAKGVACFLRSVCSVYFGQTKLQRNCALSRLQRVYPQILRKTITIPTLYAARIAC